mmetsp:Transcript_31324/g.47949  ORF Transcript_31324/g.47949 Transcript_31324/m.47949 type:complete len:102 (-) Transcript_31324:777-1082(-)
MFILGIPAYILNSLSALERKNGIFAEQKYHYAGESIERFAFSNKICCGVSCRIPTKSWAGIVTSGSTKEEAVVTNGLEECLFWCVVPCGQLLTFRLPRVDR